MIINDFILFQESRNDIKGIEKEQFVKTFKSFIVDEDNYEEDREIATEASNLSSEIKDNKLEKDKSHE